MHVPLGSWLVATDIKALYNLITHDKGVQVVRDLLSEWGQPAWQYEFVIDLLRFILTHNIFMFKCSHYLQVKGVAMGTWCAPFHTNLCLGGGGMSWFLERICQIASINKQRCQEVGTLPYGKCNVVSLWVVSWDVVLPNGQIWKPEFRVKLSNMWYCISREICLWGFLYRQNITSVFQPDTRSCITNFSHEWTCRTLPQLWPF